MKELNSLENAWLAFEGNTISDFGQGAPPQEAKAYIDAGGGIVMPTFCDSHTHLVYAGSREDEYMHKVMGLSYEEIARRGGGLLARVPRKSRVVTDLR